MSGTGRCEQWDRPVSVDKVMGCFLDALRTGLRASRREAVGPSDIAELPPQKRAPPAQTGHDGSDGNLQDLSGFLVRKFFYVGQQYYLAELSRQPIQRSQDIAVRENRRDWHGSNQRYFGHVLFLARNPLKPVAALVTHYVE